MTLTLEQDLISRAEYAKNLRPLIPTIAFKPNHSKILLLPINALILLLGWGIADQLDQWSWYWLWLYLPIALIMGNAVIALLFITHDTLHSKTIFRPWLRQVTTVLSLSMLWMTPSFWKVVHNREHHNNTNSLMDPDRNYLASQAPTWGKWIQNEFVPSAEVHRGWLILGMGFAWNIHNLRNLISALFFSDGSALHSPVPFTVSSRERRSIIAELLIVVAIHGAIITYLDFHPLKLILGYFLPLWLGHSGVMFYIYTNHMLCQMTEINDPLINSVSLKVPKIFDLLHFNFSYHTEHHIFPHMNSDYYPLLQSLIETHYPGRMNLIEVKEVWRLMLATPRHYQDTETFTDWDGKKFVACPLSIKDI
ncbi:fatty acid desaturase [Gloeocapsa sp. PCC 73106]|uniref:fatty acid desaturase family protein n=1 Tax=Gloeocapsa sp. PCC 73106 TaxID=102232 RepID=UPI0002AC2E45|nr:fatty acid desaturase [Gloeocapsa sp. PCC 73106]ELR99527.1 fatty acid desaturase [Gloeocapsa sp. PCC 73106]